MTSLLLDIITTAAILFAISSGLLIIFGVMKLINFAHAGFITVGGYCAVAITQLGWSPWISFPFAVVVGVLIGIVVEFIIVRPLYSRPLDAILATWGLGIIIRQLITMYFGREIQFAQTPISGATEIMGETYSQYRLFLVFAALLIGVILTLIMQKTKLGLMARAVIMNEPLAQSLGINSNVARLLSFGIGAGLACLSGALITPLSSVDPNMGVPWLVSGFMLVLVSGFSFESLAVACLVLGCAQVLVSTYVSPVLGGLTIAVLAALILRLNPKGFARE